MAAFSVLGTLLGLAVIVLGADPEARLNGVMLVLLCGLGPVGYFGGPLLTRRGAGTVEIVQARWKALVLRLGRRLSAYDLVLPADSFAGVGDEVIETLKTYKRDARRRRSIGSEEELARLHRLPTLAGRT